MSERRANGTNVLVLAALAAGLFAACAKVRADEAQAPTKQPAGPATVASAAPPGPSASPLRPERWAEPIAKPGLPNLHRVSDAYYRGAQPSAEGMRELERLGVKTVVNLRAVNSDRDEIGDAKLAYEHISFKAWHAEDEDVVRFLRIVTAPERQPVFVHCQHGADRTGMMTAIYRIAVEGWSKDDAVAEMTQGGYGFHAIWKDLVGYVRELDVERLKREAGVPPAPAQ
ncbi:MAG TPA: tyrosine-protein phosphatase [Polyangiaceae bacterium]